MEEIFNNSFLEYSAEKIINEINQNGFFFFEEAIKKDFVQKIENDLSQKEFGVNDNFATPVWTRKQYYFTHAMTKSKSYFDLITSKKYLSIAKTKFNKDLSYGKKHEKQHLVEHVGYHSVKDLIKLLLSRRGSGIRIDADFTARDVIEVFFSELRGGEAMVRQKLLPIRRRLSNSHLARSKPESTRERSVPDAHLVDIDEVSGR